MKKEVGTHSKFGAPEAPAIVTSEEEGAMPLDMSKLTSHVDEPLALPKKGPLKVEEMGLPDPRPSPSGRTEAQKLADDIEFTNHVLMGDPEMKDYPPVKDEATLMEAVKDGIIFAKLINFTIPNTISEKSLIRKHPMSTYEKTENLKTVLHGATKIGCSSGIVTPHMILQGKSTLVIALIDQLRKVKIAQELKKTPELILLANKGEVLEDIYKLPTEVLIVRWINFHLGNSKMKMVVSDLGKDLQDGTVYILLLNQLDPHKCTLTGLEETDVLNKMKFAINNAVNIGVRTTFNLEALLEGSNKLHFVLCCTMFNANNGLKGKFHELPLAPEAKK